MNELLARTVGRGRRSRMRKGARGVTQINSTSAGKHVRWKLKVGCRQVLINGSAKMVFKPRFFPPHLVFMPTRHTKSEQQPHHCPRTTAGARTRDLCSTHSAFFVHLFVHTTSKPEGVRVAPFLRRATHTPKACLYPSPSLLATSTAHATPAPGSGPRSLPTSPSARSHISRRWPRPRVG